MAHCKYSLTGARVLTRQGLNYGHLVVADGHIEALLPLHQSPPRPWVDCSDLLIAPGFVDLQQNGGFGLLFNDSPDTDTLAALNEGNLRHGTTGFLATLITDDDAKVAAAIEAARQYQGEGLLGLHLEGPWLNPNRGGIHDSRQIRPVSDKLLSLILGAADVVKVVTLAPEAVSPQVIGQLAKAGIKVAGGHTLADEAQSQAAIAAGLSMATHLFNAMAPISARSPGFAATALDQGLWCGLVADGVHVSAANIRLAQRLLGEKALLVTDATPASGAPDLTQFAFAGKTIQVKDGRCLGPDGTIGGSNLTMDQGVRTLVAMQVPVESALAMAGVHPRLALGLPRLMPGMKAELVGLCPDLKVRGTVQGRQLLEVAG
ncbi:N-acetylglucosamine-6-phosphate deacetylase [Gallaecimonas xiamenensis]|uniref:N-acetylglucosamine-6-phosphate deacetylase n=1 Tax=Gallaecimonas xiamenensis 3-C-1 TaxID=745411 RepID=K2JXW1_9GAMM|nr:N-acetylglucosamine-6-phosphate deacetylase [Gallaecimonas xiamenensis]EKE75139.1 N-acetylglucosamine-6-phosphate deacetylase [Gallaecimonas xiamenensis 3-C-1]